MKNLLRIRIKKRNNKEWKLYFEIWKNCHFYNFLTYLNWDTSIITSSLSNIWLHMLQGAGRLHSIHRNRPFSHCTKKKKKNYPATYTTTKTFDMFMESIQLTNRNWKTSKKMQGNYGMVLQEINLPKW